ERPWIDQPDVHLRIRLERAPQERDVLRVGVGRHEVLARREVARDGARTRADLEHAAPDPRADQIPEELGVPGQSLDTPEGRERLVLAADVGTQREAEDGPEGGEAVLPADLLALGILSAVIRDRHLVDAAAEVGDLRRELRLEPEAVGTDRDALQDV